MNSARIRPRVLPRLPKPNPHAPHPRRRSPPGGTGVHHHVDLQPAIQEVQGRLLGAERGQAHPSQETGARVELRADQGRRGGDYSRILGRMKAQGVLSVGEGPRSGGGATGQEGECPGFWVFRLGRSQVERRSRASVGVSPRCRLVSLSHRGAQSAAGAERPAPAAPQAPC